MKVSIHQPQYIPWIPYFTKIKESDVFILLDDVQFQKNGVQNRNVILSSNGEVRLTIPVNHTSSTQINKAIISDKNILKKHWKSIEQSYRKSPYFNELSAYLKPIYEQEHLLLCEVNIAIINSILKYLSIETNVIQSSSLPKEGHKSDLILALCKHVNATQYLSGTGGLDYLEKQSFLKNNIEITALEYKFIEYPQLHQNENFHEKLSIIDLLFNHGKNSINYL